jgi:hypothetical protein
MLLAVVFVLGAGLSLSACDPDSEVVNKNLSTEADNFQVLRRVVFYNAIQDKIILTVEGYCSVDPGDALRMTTTCKSGNQYFRNALGKSDNVLWWYEQMETSNVSPKHYKVVIKPEQILPSFDIR